MNTKNRIHRTWPVLAAGAVAALLALAGCSAASTASTASAPQLSSTTDTSRGDNPRQAGVSGLIAAMQDGQLQVQASDVQTTVRYTADTTVLTTASGAVADLQIGECVVAMSGDDDAITRITVTDTVDGECTTGGFPGGAGGAPGDAGGTPPNQERPQGMPSDKPTARSDGDQMPGSGERASSGAGGFPGGSITVGKVTAITVDTVTVDAVGQDDAVASTALTVNADTTVSRTVDGSATDIAQGLCVTVQGKADDAGGYDATSLTLSQPVDDGQCTTGRGGFGAPPSGNGQETDD